MASSTNSLVDVDALLASRSVTMIRDGTDAGDGSALALHLTRTILNHKTKHSAASSPLSRPSTIEPSQVLILTTRTRTDYGLPDDINGGVNYDGDKESNAALIQPHVYPHISRDVHTSLSSCKAIDPYSLHYPGKTHHGLFMNNKTGDSDITSSATIGGSDNAYTDEGWYKGNNKKASPAITSMLRLIAPHFKPHTRSNKDHQPYPRVLVIECLHSLSFCFAIDSPAFIRTLTSAPFNLSVIVSAPIGCGIDKDISNLCSIADNVIELSDLRTGVAVDIDGLITVYKRNGQWSLAGSKKSTRYKITTNSFNILQQQQS